MFAFGESGNLVSWGLIGDFYGRRNFATLRGTTSMIQSFLSLPAATWLGWVFDTTGSYSIALMPLAMAYGLAFFLYWGLHRPRRTAPVEAPA